MCPSSLKIGITGGICSGKSVVAKLIGLYGVPVYDADVNAKRLYGLPDVRQRMIDCFGKDIYAGDGQINSPLLASIIFNGDKARETVNAIIHPAVGIDFEVWATRQSTGICALESAILFESGFDKYTGVTIFVYAPEEVRVGRAAMRSGYSREETQARIQSQMPDEQKKRLASYIIDNYADKALIPQVETLMQSLLRATS